MKVGIFGGTFDPPHLGHLILAAYAQEKLELEQVLWVLTPSPPHKIEQHISGLNDRLSMVLLAITGNSHFNLSRVDIERQPPHYAVDTVNILRHNNSTDTFFYLMGADSLNDLPTWHAPTRFVDACDGLGIMRRTGQTLDLTKLEAEIPGLGDKLHFLDTPVIEISGSDIRARAKNGRQFRYLVPEKVFRYILNHKLYRN
jgi:nicotinate-nucleotide adenylyltransferase